MRRGFAKMACAFLEKSSLDLDGGCETLLRALAEILRELKLEVPAATRVQGAGGS